MGGGRPAPEITWTVIDQQGNYKEFNGERIAVGKVVIILKTKDTEKNLVITCIAENIAGRTTHSINVVTHRKYHYSLYNMIVYMPLSMHTNKYYKHIHISQIVQIVKHYCHMS